MGAIYAKLAAIQAELKAPKNQFNSFGKYNYRSCEDILEAVKPLTKAQGCAVVLSDEAVAIDGWHYIKATARLVDMLEGENESAIAVSYAREPEMKKGMDTSQITGTASSYARKYALSGLFALDDTKDADSQDNSSEGKPAQKQPAKTYCCADCGKPFVNITDRTGHAWTPAQQYDAAASVSPDGKARCRACREKLEHPASGPEQGGGNG